MQKNLHLIDSAAFLVYNGGNFRGVAQLVAREVWDFDAAGSNPVTPTKKPASAGFFSSERRHFAAAYMPASAGFFYRSDVTSLPLICPHHAGFWRQLPLHPAAPTSKIETDRPLSWAVLILLLSESGSEPAAGRRVSAVESGIAPCNTGQIA